MIRSLLFSLLMMVMFMSACTEAPVQVTKPYVIMISFDGFRYDYVQNHEMPHFEEFIKNGAAAERMLPSFPSKTFPNHYTLVTGMYPGHHGLVDNSFYAPSLEKEYAISKREVVENPDFYGGTPLWQLAQEQGLKAASYFWVGSEAPIKGMFPDYYYRYDERVPNMERVEQVIDWLHLPEAERPQLISLYFSLIDTQGHDYGPDSEEITQALQEADDLLGSLMAQLEEVALPVDVIIVSDHGMYELEKSAQSMISTEVLLNSLAASDTSVRVVNSGSQVHIYTKNTSQTDRIYQSIKPLEEAFEVYKRDEFPEAWHYDHMAAGDLLITAQPGFYFSNLTQEELEKTFADSSKIGGVHGYDPDSVDEMGGIFYANGPHILAGEHLPAFRNIHVYPLVAQLLGLTLPEDIDGKAEVLEGILKKESKQK